MPEGDVRICEYCGMPISGKAGKRFCDRKCTGAAYRFINREKVKATITAWTLRNRERARATSSAWHKANPEKSKASIAAWKKAHPEEKRIHKHNRLAREKRNGGRLSRGITSVLFIRQRGKCAVCKTSIKKTKRHLDHIMPVSRGGKNIDSNVQLTCPKCNMKKHNKDPIKFMQEMGYLL